MKLNTEVLNINRRKQRLTHYLDELKPQYDEKKWKRSVQTAPIGGYKARQGGWSPFGRTELKRNQEETAFLLLLMRTGSYNKEDRTMLLRQKKKKFRKYLHGVFFVVAMRYSLVRLFFPLK